MTGETLLTFPCDLPIKVFGRNDSAFREAAIGIVRAHYPKYIVTEQASRNGNYVSLTITVHAQTREEIDAVFIELTASDEILMVI